MKKDYSSEHLEFYSDDNDSDTPYDEKTDFLSPYNLKKLSDEELQELFFGLGASDEVSIKKVVEVATEKTNAKQKDLPPDFDFSEFGENISKEDILADAAKHRGTPTTIKHNKILNHLLDQVVKIDFEAKAGIDPDSKKKILNKHLVVIVVDELRKIASINNWNLCKNHGTIFIYNGEFWGIIEEERFAAFLFDVAMKMGVAYITANYFPFREQLFKQFLAVSYFQGPESENKDVLINLMNGTFFFGMEKQELRPHNLKDFMTHQLPFSYDPAATAPMFMDFINFALPDKNAQDVLFEFMGYCFIPTQKLKMEKALILKGSGANGKSVCFDVFRAMFGGNENVSSFSIYKLTDTTGYDRAEFEFKLLNYASEISSKMDNNIFKSLTSGEPVGARSPYCKPFTMLNYGKLAFNANELPKETEHTFAFFRRFLIIPFDKTVPEDQQDKELAKKIIDKELSGVFNLVLAGLQRLLKNRKFTPCELIENALQEYKKESDNVMLFIEEEEYVKSTEHTIPLQEFYNFYTCWCKETGHHAFARNKFSERLRTEGFVFERKSHGYIVYATTTFVDTMFSIS